MLRSSLLVVTVVSLPLLAQGAPPETVDNPFGVPDAGENVIDLRPGATNVRPPVDVNPEPEVKFSELNDYMGEAPESTRPLDEVLPEGFTQIGGAVVPDAVADGALMVTPISDFTSEPRPHAGPEECAFPDEVPAGVYQGDDKPGGEVPRRHTLYLNFLGGVLQSGGENSAENISTIARSGHPYPVFTGGEAKAVAVAQAVMEDFQYWQMRVMYETRPRKLVPYTMTMVGGSYKDTTAGPSGGVAPLDCEDFGQRNVCYSFTNTQPAISQANIISQEIGHTMGLGHTQGTDRIMGAGYSGAFGDLIFGNECTSTIAVQGQAAACVGINKCHCGDAQLQHDRTTLSWTYTAPGPDEIPPEITLTEPADGAVFTTDDTITVGMEVADNYGGYGWKLVVRDLGTDEILVDQPDYPRILTFKLKGLPVGTYELTGEIEDQADNVATHSITITVEQGAGTSAGTTSDSGSGGTDSDTGGGTDAGSGTDGGSGSDAGTDGTDGGTAGAAGEDEGCACRGSGSRGELPLAGLLLLPMLARRRQRP